MADVSALLERLGCAWEAADPAPEEYPEVPVKLKNNCLTRPLNMVTEMYSLPAYDNVDPNPLMGAVFHPLLRRDDGGYGIRTADDAGLRLCPADIPPEGNDAALLRPAGPVRHQHLCDGAP